jgi:hypothetical protein
MDQVNFWSRVRSWTFAEELLDAVLPFGEAEDGGDRSDPSGDAGLTAGGGKAGAPGLAASPDQEVGVLEPQSSALFRILMVVVIVLAWWMVTTKHLVFRLLAGGLAFLPAMTFGVMAVNKYYGYYPTWSAAFADITGQGVSAPSHLPQTRLAPSRPGPPPRTGAVPTSRARSRATTRCGST